MTTRHRDGHLGAKDSRRRSAHDGSFPLPVPLLRVRSDVLEESLDGPLQVADEMAPGGLPVLAHTGLKDAAMLPPPEFDGADLGEVQPKIRLHLPPEI